MQHFTQYIRKISSIKKSVLCGKERTYQASVLFPTGFTVSGIKASGSFLRSLLGSIHSRPYSTLRTKNKVLY